MLRSRPSWRRWTKLFEDREGRAGLAQGTIVNRVKQRNDILGLPFSSLSAAQADRSADMIEAWYLMERDPTETREKLLDFTAKLGFAPNGVQKERAGKGNVFALSTDALQDRALCPVHSFGSTADGHYRIILNDKAPARKSHHSGGWIGPESPSDHLPLRLDFLRRQGVAAPLVDQKRGSIHRSRRSACPLSGITARQHAADTGLTVRCPLPASSLLYGRWTGTQRIVLRTRNRTPQHQGSLREVVSSTAGANWGRPPCCIARRLHFTNRMPGGSPTTST